ncbi:MAG: hypothetical protein A2275_13100 [Bacteroidetes bacterium RIFOXYA12_FULL_35_11]|nr:MAG: hypothetical protein A2X01_19495 [Bacteroidetes bacterium GWF2_35_48]OFY74831.1 MAG: hypothetical protein A2275_13100 [Bacteroidetes bacterium RIFOXYA12_FULL_35_11]
MQRLIIETDSIANANFLASFLRTVKSVKKVVIEKPFPKEEHFDPSTGSGLNVTPAEEYNWTNPTRPATDKEFEQLCLEMDAEEAEGKYFTMEEAKAKTLKSIEQWKKKSLK